MCGDLTLHHVAEKTLDAPQSSGKWITYCQGPVAYWLSYAIT